MNLLCCVRNGTGNVGLDGFSCRLPSSRTSLVKLLAYVHCQKSCLTSLYVATNQRITAGKRCCMQVATPVIIIIIMGA